MRLSIQRGDGTVNAVPSWENSAEPWPDHDGLIYAYGHVDGNQHWIHIPGLASFSFSASSEEVAATVSKDHSDELIDAFHRRVLPMAVQVRGREVLHASAIRADAGVLGFCGVTRSGKSTIAFGLHDRGYELWADDMVAFEVSNGSPIAVSLPFKPRLRKSSAYLFSRQTIEQKLVAYDAAPAGSERTPLAALCILRQNAASSEIVSIRRLSSGDSLATVLDHACCFYPADPQRKRLMIQHYLDLVAVTPIFEVSYQPGLQNFPALLDAVERLLDSPA
jgi:hypothetical protein